MDPVSSDTPLMLACRAGKTDVVSYCLQHGAKNDPHPDFGQTALHAAVSAGHFGCARIILDEAAMSSADSMIANLTDPRLQTPLHVACSQGAEEIAVLLLNHGASVSEMDVGGMTCLHLCCQAGHKTCLALILDHGGDDLISSVDLAGNTALHLAAANGHISCVRLLVETAADVNVKNYAGLTPYMLSSKRGHHQIGLMLLKYHDSDASKDKETSKTALAVQSSSRLLSPGTSRSVSSASIVGSIVDRNSKK